MKKGISLIVTLLVLIIIVVIASTIIVLVNENRPNANNNNSIDIDNENKTTEDSQKENQNTNTNSPIGSGIYLSEYFYELDSLEPNGTTYFNGVVDSCVVSKGEKINYVGTSFASTKSSEDFCKVVNKQEAMAFISEYSDIEESVSKSWYNENFLEDMIYVIVSSKTFHKEYSAFPDFRYDKNKNEGYLIFEKFKLHSTVNPQKENLEDVIRENAKATYTIIAIDKSNTLEKINLVLPEQFEENEGKFEVDAFTVIDNPVVYDINYSNNIQSIAEGRLEALSISLDKQNPQGLIVLNKDELTKLSDRNALEIDNKFLKEDRVYVLLSSYKFENDKGVGMEGVEYDKNKNRLYIVCKSKDSIKNNNVPNATCLLISIDKTWAESIDDFKFRFKVY